METEEIRFELEWRFGLVYYLIDEESELVIEIDLKITEKRHCINFFCI